MGSEKGKVTVNEKWNAIESLDTILVNSVGREFSIIYKTIPFLNQEAVIYRRQYDQVKDYIKVMAKTIKGNDSDSAIYEIALRLATLINGFS